MNVLVDTSVWSLALRRDKPSGAPEVAALGRILMGGTVFTTGLILQELLQGFDGPRARDRILSEFSMLPIIVPDRGDHVEAAELRNLCRRRGIQVGTIDALLARLAIHHGLQLLTCDQDFQRIAGQSLLQVFEP